MGKIPDSLRHAIANNIRTLRQEKFPGYGGGKRCAEAFGVSPQQWSPWECGVRIPDEMRLVRIASFFGVTVEDLRRPAPDSSSTPHALRNPAIPREPAQPHQLSDTAGRESPRLVLPDWFLQALLTRGLRIELAVNQHRYSCEISLRG